MARMKAPGVHFQTKQELVYQTLRTAIMHCEIQPGERLVIEDIAQQLNVSPIPVREALQLLQSERLIEVVPHVGATVAPISPASVAEIFTLMEGLEMVATRAAAQRLTPEDVRDLTLLLVEMDEAAKDEHDRWADLNTEFHRTIGRITCMPMLQEMTDQVLAHWDRIRRYFFKRVFLHRIQQAQHEHHEILHAMQERNFVLLEGLVKIHTQGALAAYMGHLDKLQADESDAHRDLFAEARML